MTEAARYNVGDTFPALRGLAADRAGPLLLMEAESVTVRLTSDMATVGGPATVLYPPADPDGLEGGPFNWQYNFADADLATAGTYALALDIVWNSGTDPVQRQTIPNAGIDRLLVGVGAWYPTVDMVAQQWLRARTYLGLDVPAGAQAGGDAGTFTDETSPTRAEAEAAIDGAVAKVLSHFPRLEVHSRSYQAAQHAATIYAALEIELGYFPEQSAAESAFLQLRGLSEAATLALVNGANVNALFGEGAGVYLDGVTVAVGLADDEV